MATNQIARILDRHGVPYYIEGGRIYADSMAAFTDLFAEVMDLTGYTYRKLLVWLGY